MIFLSWGNYSKLYFNLTEYYLYIYILTLLIECSPMTGRLRINLRSSYTKDSEMVLDAALLNTQHYKVRIKGKVMPPL